MKRLALMATLVFIALAASAAVDLSKMEADVAAKKAVLANAKTRTAEKLRARYELMKWELLTCEEKDYADKEKEMIEFLSDPGETPPADFVAFLLGTVHRDRETPYRRIDVFAVADKVSRTEMKARWQYFRSRLQAILSLKQNWTWRSLDRETSFERALELVAECESEPETVKGHELDLFKFRFAALVALAKYEEAEALAEKTLALNDPKISPYVLPVLGDYYRDRAKRYYDDDEPSVLRKAEAAYAKYVSLPDISKKMTQIYFNALKSLGEVRLQLGDFAGARSAAETLKASRRPGADNRDADTLLADVAFASGDYSRAAELFAALREPEKKKELDGKRLINYAIALKVLGRRDECLKIIEAAKAKNGKYIRQRLDFHSERLSAK